MMMSRFAVWLCIGVVVGLAGSATAADLADQRQMYQQAVTAIEAGDDARSAELARQLRGYPLYPYLIYYRLRKQLDHVPDSRLQAFLDSYSGTAVAWRLRGNWLQRLAATGRWRRFLAIYDQRPGVALRCYYLRARIRAGDLDGVAEAAGALWLAGSSRPPECDRLFQWMKAKGLITAEMVWQRVGLAMANDQPGLAGYLANMLDRRDQQWIALWQKVHRDPARWLASKQLERDTLAARRIVADGVRRLIAVDLDQARAVWASIRHRYAAGRAIQGRLDRDIALYAALRHQPDAADLLDALADSAHDAVTREWAVRTAVRGGDWRAVIAAVQALSASQRGQQQWRYWLARAFDQTGQHERAHALYRQLATERSYYGFLAADRIGRPYSISDRPLVVDEDAIAAVSDTPAIRRARELYALHDLVDARREWNRATDEMNRGELKTAAVLADRWGWHATAIRTVARAGDFDDIALRFPTPYRAEIARAASRDHLSRTWLYGIMRRESAFMSDARSYAGALGLMQLMPATARNISRQLERPPPAATELLDGPQNIALGSAYLRYLVDYYGQNRVLAVAAYNAGPNRVDKWLPTHRQLPADRWIDAIPYPETRNYIHAVLTYTEIFRWALDDHSPRLSVSMAPIAPKSEVASGAPPALPSG